MSAPAFTDAAAAFASSSSAIVVAASTYCGIANGESGASGFLRGRVATQASNAGTNSGRKRLR